MKTLKKTLCLVLAVVMAVGVLVIPANAATSFPDDDKITHDEAVAVLNGLGILKGDDKGNFNPEEILTRAQAAKIIAYMMLGEDDAEDYVASGDPFTDMAGAEWAVNYVAFCADNDIIGGNGDGTFTPGGELTGTAFAKMLLCALGYDGDNEGFGGSNWAKNVESVARDVGLNDDLTSFKYSAPLTRDSAAQMAYNALWISQVRAYVGGTNIELPGGVTITQGATKQYTNTLAYEYGIDIRAGAVGATDADGNKIGMRSDKDNLGRPNAYQVVALDAGDNPVSALYTQPKSPVKVYTAEAKVDAVNKDLKDYTFATGATKDEVITKNGVDEASTDAIGTNIGTIIHDLAKNGVAVEVYANNNRQITDIIVVEKVLAKVKSTASDKIVLSVGAGVNTNRSDIEVESKEDGKNRSFYKTLSNYDKGDYLMVAYSGTDTIREIADVQEVVGTLTGKGTAITGSTHSKSYTIGGTKYTTAENEQATWGTGATEPRLDGSTDVTVLLDQYGYLVDFLKAVEAVPTYVYVVHEYYEADAWLTNIRMFQGVLTDGTEVVAEYNMTTDTGTNDEANKAQVDHVYKYTESDGVYTLTLETAKAVQLTSAEVKSSDKRINTNGNFYSNNVQTVFINGSKDKLKVSVNSGVVNAKIENSNDYAIVENNLVTTLFINGSASPELSTDLIYVKAGTAANGTTLDDDGKSCDTYEVYINGEKETIMINPNLINNTTFTPATAGWYKYTVNSAGRYVLDNTGITNVVNDAVLSQSTATSTIEPGDGVYYITVTASSVSLADATDAKVVDLRSGISDSDKITSVETLSSVVNATEGSKNVTVSFSYSGTSSKVVNTIYVTAAN